MALSPVRPRYARRPALHRRTTLPGKVRFLMTPCANPRSRLAPRTSPRESVPRWQISFKTTLNRAAQNGSIAHHSCNRKPLSVAFSEHGSSKKRLDNHQTIFNPHNPKPGSPRSRRLRLPSYPQIENDSPTESRHPEHSSAGRFRSWLAVIREQHRN